ncbi:unnamed protein product [Haemonchus placei]|uniref:PH domain-containing protein n=1 Tax=Haemonchus placei TaxID=6290 RepID=A0A0N4WPT7_HAEPC|nr:unnamed protein product [Haemonchus placei]
MAEDHNWDADERRSRWLRDLLGKSEDESITPEVQVAAIRALIMECQKRGVEQVLKRTRKPLKRWKHIAWVVGILKIVCAVVITIKVVRIRYDYSLIITNSLDSLILKMITHCYSVYQVLFKLTDDSPRALRVHIMHGTRLVAA